MQRELTVKPNASCRSFPWALSRRRSDVVITRISPIRMLYYLSERIPWREATRRVFPCLVREMTTTSTAGQLHRVDGGSAASAWSTPSPAQVLGKSFVSLGVGGPAP